MHDLRGSVVLQQGSIKQARMLDVLAVLMHRNAEARPARRGKRFCLESGSEKEAAARRMFRRCSPRKGMYYGTSSGRLAGCHAGPTRPPESAAEASATYAAREHLPRAQQFANPCGGHSRQRRTNFPTIWGCKPSFSPLIIDGALWSGQIFTNLEFEISWRRGLGAGRPGGVWSLFRLHSAILGRLVPQ